MASTPSAAQGAARSKTSKPSSRRAGAGSAARRVESGRVVVEKAAAKGQRGGREKAAGKAGAGGERRRKVRRYGAQGGKGRAAKRTFTARTADRHELYQLSVQSPEEDVRFLSRVYKTFRGKPARHLREDFCGTALLTSHWIRRGEEFTAEGFDIDPEPLEWGRERSFEPLGRDAERATLHRKDVRAPSDRRPDVRCAQNFSYFVFKERRELLDYCKRAHADLARDGVFVMDIYGGPEAMEEMLEERRIDEGFTYVWDQDEYCPATGDYRAFIHFKFRDGTQLRRAFRYDWRLWTLPEVRDVLLEAGFRSVEQYWEGTDADGESGNGVYRRSKRGENCLAWVTYLVALK